MGPCRLTAVKITQKMAMKGGRTVFYVHIEFLDLPFGIVESLKKKSLAYELVCCPLMSCTDYNPDLY